jgi:colanic acid biosynthesis glycosyl transferase WcaI
VKILVVTLLYAPDGGPSAPLFSTLCEQLAKMGHQVAVIAAVPHYPTGKVSHAYQKGWIQRTHENGVKVIRIRVPSGNRNNLALRLFQFFIYQLGAAWAGLRHPYDVALITNPALEVGIPFALLSLIRRKPSVFWVADVYPQVGIQLGIFRHRIVIQLVSAIERFCLHRARLVWMFAESFRSALHQMGVPNSKIVLIHSWVDTDFIQVLPRQNSFSTEFHLDDCFVVLYAGNIGLSQDWDNVLLSAQELKQQADILFVFVGDGTGKAQLMARANQMKLNNVRFIPFQPHDRIPEVLATADIAFASLQSGMATGSIPSKIFSYLASGRPVLAMLDNTSDACQMMHQSGGGLCVSPASPRELAENIQVLKQSPALRKQLGRSGREYILERHSTSQVARQVETLLMQAIRPPGESRNA